jgi:hypothetical protein
MAGVITGAFAFGVSAGDLVSTGARDDAETWAIFRWAALPAEPPGRAVALTLFGPVVTVGAGSPAVEREIAVRELAAAVDRDCAGRFDAAGRVAEATWAVPVRGAFSGVRSGVFSGVFPADATGPISGGRDVRGFACATTRFPVGADRNGSPSGRVFRERRLPVATWRPVDFCFFVFGRLSASDACPTSSSDASCESGVPETELDARPSREAPAQPPVQSAPAPRQMIPASAIHRRAG